MNFIKKKIKGKKAITSDDDDLDPNLFHVPRPDGPEGWVPYDERIDQESEEWLAFKQLTQRVSDTLQQTQRNLSKIVAESALDEQSKNIKTVVAHIDDEPAEPAKPSRPPPPRPAPPRPPQPAAHPPPDELKLEFDLHAEFGFSASPIAPVAAGSLFLDDDTNVDEDDPFDTSFVAAAAPLSTEGIPGVVPIDDLDFGQNPDEDDPFVVDMDPFESFLGAATAAPQRAKSPNPFLTDPEPPALASSNPFAPSAANDVDFFADAAAPNPFAAAQPHSADILDLFGSNDVPEPPNPFGAYGQPAQPAQPAPNIFDMDFEAPAAAAIPPPMMPQASAPKSQSSQPQPADPFAALMDDPAPAAEPDLFGFDASDPFGATSPPSDFAAENRRISFDAPPPPENDNRRVSFEALPQGPPVRRISFEAATVANDLDDAFGGGSAAKARPPIPPKSANFPDTFAAKEAAPPRPPPPCRPARPPPPAITVKMDQPGLAWDAPPAAAPAKQDPDPFGMFDGMDEAVVAAPTAFGATPSAFDADAADDATTPCFDGDPFGDVPPMDEKIEFEPIPCAVVKSEVINSDAFVAFDSADGVPDRRPSIDSRKSSAEAVVPLQAAERRQSKDVAPPTKTSPPMSALDFFTDFDTGVEPKRVPPLPAASIPRPPSVEVLDAFGFEAPAPKQEAPMASKAPAVEVLDAFGFEATVPKPEASMASVAPVVEVLDAFGFEATAPKREAPVASMAPAFDLMSESDAMFPVETAAEFDAFDAKFQSMEGQSTGAFDAFGDVGGSGCDAFGDGGDAAAPAGFGAADEFDPFFAIKETPAAPKPSPARFTKKAAKAGDEDSDSDFDDDDIGPDFSVFIRPKIRDKDDAAASLHLGPIPVLAPPPKSPLRSPTRTSPTPRFNPFDKEPRAAEAALEPEPATPPEVPRDLPVTAAPGTLEKTESQESPGSPLFELDDSEPLDDFYPPFQDEGWELLLRQPSKKKLTGQRFWKKVWVTLSDNGVIHLYNKKDDKDAFQELPLQACYSLSEVGAQQYDAYGKIFTVKLQYVFYRERVGVRPGQISKVAHGQITSLGQLAKLGLPLEHAPQVSQLLKLASPTYSELKVFVRLLEDTLFHLTVHRDRALTSKTEEVQVTVIDELRADVACSGVVLQQLARVRVFFLAFITSMPDVEIGLNDITKQGKEVVGRHDIIPVITEEWIRLEKCEFHSCVLVDEFEKHRNIKLHPPDACFFELLRFRIRPPRNRELPLQVKTTMSVIGSRVEIRADVLVPGCISRKHGQIPCEDVAIRFPLPECWIYLFRVEKHFRYGSVKSASRKPGKIKGLERFMGAGLTLEPSLIEVSTGQAKYEHQHRAIVWRIPRLPKDGQGAYTTQLFVCRMELTSYDQIPEEFDRYIYVEFNMPATTVSHTTVRSVSVTNPNPPEKYVKYLARHEYRVEMEHVTVASECEYMAATAVSANSAANSAGGSGSPVPSQ